MTVTVAVLTTDGRRDTLQQTIESFGQQVMGDIVRRIIFTDVGNPEHLAWLATEFTGWDIVACGPKQGYAAAMAAAWAYLANDDESDHIFWLEDDFTFNQVVDLHLMGRVLDRNPMLMQLALRRQPWNEEERAAGGVVESHADWYTDVRDHDLRVDWLEQTAFWTNNPSLFRSEVCDVPYPTHANAEGRYTFQLKDVFPGCCFGYWGARSSGEWVHHIGAVSVRGAF